MRLRAFVLSLCAAPLLAQGSAGPELVPRELVDGLLATRGLRQPILFVGEIPREIAGRIYIPANARVVGGMSTGATSTVILLSNARREAIAADLEKELPKLGWKQYDPSARVSPYSEFRDAPLPASGMRVNPNGPQMFCGPNGGMTINLEPSGFADTRISITATDMNMCAQSTAMSMGGPGREDLAARPVFINPTGARSDMSACFRGGDEGFNWASGGGASLATTMTPEALLEHYSKQMADSGWTATNIVKAARTWTRTDSAGKLLRYTMTIEATGNAPCRRIETRFERRR